MTTNTELEVKRNALVKLSKQYEEQINLEVESLKDKAIDMGKYALVAGGIAVAGYFVVKFIFNIVVSDDEEDEKPAQKIIHLPVEHGTSLPYIREAKEQPLVVKLIMSAIATFLLSIAKQKLTQFLEKIYANEADKNSTPAA